MSDGWKMKDGKRPYLQRLKRLEKMAETYGAQTRTTGRGDRSEAKNIIALRTNAKRGRDVMGVSDKERAEGQDIWDKATTEFLKTGHNGILERAADAIGKLLVRSLRNHITRGVSADGSPLRPVKPSTAKRKKRETGSDDLPPMLRTGALMRSFIYKVVKR
jgi:hypothetical protein